MLKQQEKESSRSEALSSTTAPTPLGETRTVGHSLTQLAPGPHYATG